VDPVRDGFDESSQELGSDMPASLLVQSGEGDLGDPVDGDEQIELPGFGPDLGDIDVEVADGVGLELPSRRSVAVDIRQASDAVTLEATMKRGPCQARDRRLKGIEAVRPGPAACAAGRRRRSPLPPASGPSSGVPVGLYADRPHRHGYATWLPFCD
jgi:hypothetical protein